jgi:lipoprotein-releasing system permease protein
VNVSAFIARKYFFSRKNPSAINIITGISMAGYSIGSLALIILLSALNGFEESIFGDYQRSSPDLKIVPLEGKVFEPKKDLLQYLGNNKGIAAYALALEDKAIIKYGDQQVVGVVRGLDSAFTKVFEVDSWVKAGTAELNYDDNFLGNAWLSEGLVYTLNVSNSDQRLELLTPDRSSSNVAQTTLNQEALRISSMVHLSSEENERTVIVPLWVTRSLFDRETEISHISLKTKGSPFLLQGEINERLKPLGLVALNRQEQNETMYKMFNTEKWFSFALLVFILLLISFNLYGALRMMRIDKREDIYILSAMGMPERKRSAIFTWEAFFVSGLGTLIGLVLGILLIFVQQRFGIITTQATFELVYPVSLRWWDVLMVAVICIGLTPMGLVGRSRS